MEDPNPTPPPSTFADLLATITVDENNLTAEVLELKKLVTGLIQALTHKTDSPVQPEYDRGIELQTSARINGLTFDQIKSESVWVGILASFGAVERLQTQVAEILARIAELPDGRPDNSEPKSTA